MHVEKLTSVVPLLIALLALPAVSSAGIKCWTNKDGVRECGNSVPPEYTQQGYEELNSRGMVTNEQQRAKTPEELAAEAEERERRAKQRAERARLAKEQAARDRVLLDTFTTEEDLRLARDGKLAALDARIQHTRRVVDKLRGNLVALQQRAATAELTGKAVSEKTHEEIRRTKRRLSEHEGFIDLRESEKTELNAQFQTDLARYRELKSN